MVRGSPQNAQEARLYVSKLVLAAVFAVRDFPDVIQNTPPSTSFVQDSTEPLTARLREVGVISPKYSAFMTRTEDRQLLFAETDVFAVERETADGSVDKNYHVLDVYKPGNPATVDIQCFIFGDVSNGNYIDYAIKEHDVMFEDNRYEQHFDKGVPQSLFLQPIATTRAMNEAAYYFGGKVNLSYPVKFSLAQQLKKSWSEGVLPDWTFYRIQQQGRGTVEVSVYVPGYR